MKRLKKLAPLILASSLMCHVTYAMHASRENADTESTQAPPPAAHSTVSTASSIAFSDAVLAFKTHISVRKPSQTLYTPGVLGKAKPLIPTLTQQTMQKIYELERGRFQSLPRGQHDPLVSLTDAICVNAPQAIQTARKLETYLTQRKYQISSLMKELLLLHRQDPAWLRDAASRAGHTIEQDPEIGLPIADPLKFLTFVGLKNWRDLKNLSDVYAKAHQLDDFLSEPVKIDGETETFVTLVNKFNRSFTITNSAIDEIREMIKALDDPKKKETVLQFEEALNALRPLFQPLPAIGGSHEYMQALWAAEEQGEASAPTAPRAASVDTVTAEAAEANGLEIDRREPTSVTVPATPRTAQTRSPDSFSSLSLDSEGSAAAPRSAARTVPAPAATAVPTDKPPLPRAPTPTRLRPTINSAASSSRTVSMPQAQGSDQLDKEIAKLQPEAATTGNGRKLIRNLRNILLSSGVITGGSSDPDQALLVRLPGSGDLGTDAATIQTAMQKVLAANGASVGVARVLWDEKIAAKSASNMNSSMMSTN